MTSDSDRAIQQHHVLKQRLLPNSGKLSFSFTTWNTTWTASQRPYICFNQCQSLAKNLACPNASLHGHLRETLGWQKNSLAKRKDDRKFKELLVTMGRLQSQPTMATNLFEQNFREARRPPPIGAGSPSHWSVRLGMLPSPTPSWLQQPSYMTSSHWLTIF